MQTRDETTEKDYETFLSNIADTCVLCGDNIAGYNKIVEICEHFFISFNRFPYITWDNRKVDEHLLITPKRHITLLVEMTDSERAEYFTVLARYETIGYSFYQRSQTNTARSIKHLHTHLFLLAP